jgi:hypothetical protein
MRDDKQTCILKKIIWGVGAIILKKNKYIFEF